MSWFLSYKYHILVFFLSFFLLTKFNFDPDLGWHLAMGERFLRDGTILRFDEFSWTMPGYHWGNSYFLYQIFVSFLFTKAGFVTTVFVFGLIASLAIVLVLPRKLDLVKLFPFMLGVGLAQVSVAIRPHTVSLLFFAVLLVFLRRKFIEKPLFLIFWFVFFSLWANFHRGFVLGLGVLVLFLITDFVNGRVQKKVAPVYSKIAVFAAAFLGTFVTPFTFDVWKSGIVIDLTSTENLLSIAEWQPVAISLATSILFVASGIIFILIVMRSFVPQSGVQDDGRRGFKGVEPFWVFCGAFLFMLSFVAITFVFFWALVFIYITTRSFEFKLPVPGDIWSRIPLVFALGAVLVTFPLNFVAHFIDSSYLPLRLLKDGYPVQAVIYMKENELTNRLFNDYKWGGYLNWQFPEAKVFIDGRMASWKSDSGRAILGDYLAITRGDCAVIEQYGIQTVLIGSKTHISCFEGWKTVYENEVAKVLVK